MRQIATLLLFLLSQWAYTQTKSETNIGVTLSSMQYWRGMALSTKPCIQPEATWGIGNFSFNIWTSMAIDKNYSEIDLTPTWTIGDFDLSLIDYYCPITGESNHFFEFGEESNRHSTEFQLAYYANKLPVNITIATFFAGDKNEDTDKPYYSTYAEVGYPFSMGPIDAEVALGFTPANGYYATKTAIVQSRITIGKEIELKHGLTLPINLSLNVNPNTSETFVVFTMGLFHNSSTH